MGRKLEALLPTDDVDEPDLDPVHVLGPVHKTELEAADVTCPIEKVDLNGLAVVQSVVQDAAALEPIEFTLGDIYYVVLPTGEIALDHADQPELEPLRYPLGSLVDDADVHAPDRDVLVLEAQA